MTLEEAVNILEKDIHTDPPKSAITARKHDEAIFMALKALEKQIPKKPIERFTGNEYVCECPICHGLTDTPKEVVVQSIQHCSWCGQKLDWSEISER